MSKLVAILAQSTVVLAPRIDAGQTAAYLAHLPPLGEELALGWGTLLAGGK